jgi:hypothetical protein
LTLDPNRDYQPRGLPPGPPKKPPEMQRCPKTPANGVPRHHIVRKKLRTPPET